MKIKYILSLWSAIGLFSNLNGAVLLSVDGTGANKNVNTESSLTWNFTWAGNNTYIFDLANFRVTLDQGIDPNSKLIMTLYNGFGGNITGNTVASVGGVETIVEVTAAQIAAQTGGGFKLVNFFFPESGSVAQGNYSVQLTSTAAAGNDFNVKIGAIKLFDGTTNTELSASLYNTDGNTDGTSTAAVIPEPSSVLLGMIGALGLLRRRRA